MTCGKESVGLREAEHPAELKTPEETQEGS